MYERLSGYEERRLLPRLLQDRLLPHAPQGGRREAEAEGV